MEFTTADIQKLTETLQQVKQVDRTINNTKPGNSTNPTTKTYTSLTDAYNLFNEKLFNNSLPACLITMQRKKNSRGYFVSEQFINSTDESDKTDEIALNPSSFTGRTTQEILSTLAHEMTHLWQAHHGKPARRGYHNKQWASKMAEIGLISSNTGEPNGKRTGQSMTHYILESGLFDITSKPLLATTILYKEQPRDEILAKKKAQSKTKYSCPDCDTNAWAKPDTHLICGHCNSDMEAEQV